MWRFRGSDTLSTAKCDSSRGLFPFPHWGDSAPLILPRGFDPCRTFMFLPPPLQHFTLVPPLVSGKQSYLKTAITRLKKINRMSQSCRAHLFYRCAFDSAKFKVWLFFACLIFFFSFLWTCLSKYTRKDMTDTMKHFEQQTSSTLCSVLYLVHPKSSSIFQSCERLKSDMSAARGGGGRNCFKKRI